jgi:hypothetical protein
VIRIAKCAVLRACKRRENYSLLFVLLLAAGCVASCSTNRADKPEIPASVSPGWKLSSFDRAVVPAALSSLKDAPECWRGKYDGEGTAEVWVCGYKAREGAFDAVQRARAEAQTVKFQEGSWLVLVKWNNVPKTSLTALIRAIQRALQPKG